MGRDTGKERSCDASGSGTLSTGLKLATNMPYACMGSRLIETTRDSAFLFFLSSFLKEENQIRLLPIPIKKSI